MENNGIESLIELIKRIEVTEDNKKQINKINKLIEQEDYLEAIKILNELKKQGQIKLKDVSILDLMRDKEEISQEELDEELFKEDIIPEKKEKEKTENSIYPKELSDEELEERYIGLLLENPKAISMYYIIHEDCYFKSDKLLNLYKSILFT